MQMSLLLAWSFIILSVYCYNLVLASLIKFLLQVTHRAKHFGAGCGPDAAALLVGTFRRSSWPAPVFYTQLFTAALLCLSQAPQSTCFIWRAFIVGRVGILYLQSPFHLKMTGLSFLLS